MLTNLFSARVKQLGLWRFECPSVFPVCSSRAGIDLNSLCMNAQDDFFSFGRFQICGDLWPGKLLLCHSDRNQSQRTERSSVYSFQWKHLSHLASVFNTQ